MKPELIKFVAGTKAKASEVNENFEKVLNYAETASAVVSFDIETEYKFGQWVLGQVDDEFGFYESLVDENKGHLLSDENYWKKVSMGGAGLEIGDIGIAPLGIDESLGKRRYLNGSILVQEQYPYFTQKVKTAIQTYASLGCTEEEWQTISNMSVGGQCGKFVVDDTAGTIRLPKIIMPIQGLTNLTNLGEIVSAGLPNITGEWSARQLTHLGQVTASGALYASANSYAGTSQDNNGGNAGIGLDASLSSAIYGNSNTVQQEQIQYPYFIQVATGSAYQENITNEIELNNPFVLLEGQYFTAPVYNSSWLQSNVSFTGSLALHPTAYNALLVEQNPNVEVGTTVDNYTKRGLSVKLDTEDYTDYDFVLNTTSQTFRCPLKINKASGRAVVGNGIGLGLTDGEDFSSIVEYSENIKSRLNYGQAVGTVNTGTASFVNNATLGVTTDATKSGIETSDDNVYLYFYVGETVQNANLVNVGRVEEKISNIIPDNSDLIASYAMPSGRYDDIVLGADSTTYTAPANGWYYINKVSGGSSKYMNIFVNGDSHETCEYCGSAQALTSETTLVLLIPVKKNDTILVNYSASGTLHAFRFIYAEGAK